MSQEFIDQIKRGLIERGYQIAGGPNFRAGKGGERFYDTYIFGVHPQIGPQIKGLSGQMETVIVHTEYKPK